MTGLDIVSFDENLVTELADRFELRTPNREALVAVIKRIESGNYEPLKQLVLNLATGAGKTYVMASLIEYLNRQGVHNIMVVTPNKVVQDKTIRDFTAGSDRYIKGFRTPPRLITPENMQDLRLADSSKTLFGGDGASNLYIFNVQQLFPPKDNGKTVATGTEAARRKTWKWQEEFGSLAEHLISLDDLVVIVDEVHLFGTTATVYRSALEALEPAATVGLTASASDTNDDIVFEYPLWRAIKDGYVKKPVLVYRKSGYDTEERQLHDALSLLRLKEEAYESYRIAHPDNKQTKPLLFVVCSSVTHATDTAEILRSPKFVGNQQQVLQVDNEHDDATTQTYLRNLDQDHSPVRVIVSVNKLREGWDTKRIAVMCTLRAMGSEVLTQQIMGRGLRLPFGKQTDVETINQLDIISHKSFVSLLKDENVLREFGIENAVPPEVDPKKLLPPSPVTLVVDGTGTSTTGETDTGDGPLDLPPVVPGESHDETSKRGATETVGVKGLDDDEEITTGHEVVVPVTVSVQDEFKGTTFYFPSSLMNKTVMPFSLADIENASITQAARNTRDSKEYLQRTEIVVEASGDTTAKIKAEAVSNAVVDSVSVSASSVANELSKRVLASQKVHASAENSAQLTGRIVPVFMQNTGIINWTEKAKQSAVDELYKMVAKELTQAERTTQASTQIVPVKLPITDSFTLQLGKKVREKLEVDEKSTAKSTGFVKKEFYGAWKNGLFPAAAFDSFSAEYKLAVLFTRDEENVRWWKRIYGNEGAQIAYTVRDNYIPDFVVCDKTGRLWVVEAKAQTGEEDPNVQAKRKAAERVIRLLVGLPEFAGQKWGYVIAYESDIATADSFEDLVNKCDVEKTPDLQF